MTSTGIIRAPSGHSTGESQNKSSHRPLSKLYQGQAPMSIRKLLIKDQLDTIISAITKAPKLRYSTHLVPRDSISRLQMLRDLGSISPKMTSPTRANTSCRSVLQLDRGSFWTVEDFPSPNYQPEDLSLLGLAVTAALHSSGNTT